MNFSERFLQECSQVIVALQRAQIEGVVDALCEIRERKGRLFLVGSGGGAGYASHAACDFRKLCGIECYAPYDNVSELTARVNDEGWEVSLSQWLKVSRMKEEDGLFVFSVGGGSVDPSISLNLVNAIQHTKECQGKVIGIVGKEGGYTNEKGDAVIVIPVIAPEHVTPLTEGFQAVLWHLLVSHPKLQLHSTKWEAVQKGAAIA